MIKKYQNYYLALENRGKERPQEIFKKLLIVNNKF